MVLPKENIDHLNQLFEGKIPTNIQIEIMPNANHAFSIAPDRCFDLDDEIFWQTTPQFECPESFQMKIEEWVEKQIMDIHP